ncbi:hypothetical protein M9H77_07909 [Catharanthus roseus]|uniref:Uncharacterized protein n=1 Tax=Catharanthus roseus TaxID=4058 RepID=A0ACC0BWG7_CATRO|nr:hypothetical protein M9H77_07909 [Catharanthus roseus]
MEQSKDPFEVTFEEQEESPPESPIAPDENETQIPPKEDDEEEEEENMEIELGKLTSTGDPDKMAKMQYESFRRSGFQKSNMKRRKERGPIRPYHIREAYRRLKLEGKVPRRSVPRLFR